METYNSNIWTPTMRNDFVRRAETSSVERGYSGPYWFNVLPKNIKPDEENDKKSKVTKTLMKTIFENPEYRIFVLKIYDILVNKLVMNPFTRVHFQKNIVVQLKGGTSYTYAVGDSEEFPFSDLDIVIYINPYLPSDLFNVLKETVGTIVLQTMSQYKRSIDFMFFNSRERIPPQQLEEMIAREQFVSNDLIQAFKEDLNDALAEMSDEEGAFVSPFENREFRDLASKYSYIITNSDSFENSVVRVELPHFEGCERIPLRKTPLFCSYNKSIRFNRAANPEEKKLVGAFDLYRLRFNTLYVPKKANENSSKFHKENVTADFIDISIPHQDDEELLDFWMHGQTGMVKDDATNIWIVIPDIATMVNDLYKMLYVYECPESKYEKRLKKYEILSKMLKE